MTLFSFGHILWIVISGLLILAGTAVCIRRKPDIDRLMKICFVFSLGSEVIKYFSMIQIVPMVDPAIAEQNGTMVLSSVPIGQYTPMLPLEHLPLELCSIQMLFMGLYCLVNDEKKKHWIRAFMFPCGVLGAALGILLPSLTAYLHTNAEYFLTIRAWQYFLYHAMLVVLCLYLGISEKGQLKFQDWKTAVTLLIALDLPTFYLNSIFSNQVYQNDHLIGVTHRINYFSSYVNPLGLVLTEKWQWGVYLLIRAVLAVGLIILIYTPLRHARSADE